MATLIRTTDDTKTCTPIRPENGRDFKLAELYRLLGCEMVEIVSLKHGYILVIDEEGKLTDKAPNPCASDLAWLDRAIDRTDYIAGDALLCHSKEVR
jgi:hypothetical protein